MGAGSDGVGEAFGEAFGEAGVEDFGLGFGEVVGDAAEFDLGLGGVVDGVGGAPIAIAGLADGAAVDVVFFSGLEDEFAVEALVDGAIEDEGVGDVGVAEEAELAALVDEALFGFLGAEDVNPAGGAIEGGVDDGEVCDGALHGESAEVAFLFFVEAIAGVFHGHVGEVAEVFDVPFFGGFFVMVAFDDGATEGADEFEAFGGAGVVADDVAKANHVADALGLHVFQDGFERLLIAVDVGENSVAH